MMEREEKKNSDLPEGWKKYQLGNLKVADLIMGQSPSSESYNDQGIGLPFFQGKADFGSIYPTVRKWCSTPIKKVIKNDILMSVRAPVGDVNICLENSCIGRGLAAIRSKELSYYLYLFYYLLYNKEDIMQYGTGTTFQSINRTVLDKYSVNLPSLHEQKKIAAILYKIQQAIEAQDEIIKKTKELKKSTMQFLFTRGLYGEKTKQTEIGEMPKGWEVGKLGDYATLVTKGSSPRWQGFEYCNKGILFIRSQNIGWGKLLLDDKVFVPESFNRKEKRSILKTDDVLINLVGASIGRVAVADKYLEGANTNQAVALVRLDKSKMLSRFIMYYLFTYNGQNEITFNIKEIARANISLMDINNINIPIIEVKEQNEIVSILLTIDQKIELAERKKQTLNNLFQSMLNKLMIGAIRLI